MADRDFYLRIEAMEDYSPVEPDPFAIPPIQYKRDGMHYMGHPMGVIPDAERDARALRAVTFREYQDADYLIPRTSKLVHADINEPVWNHRVPGCVLYAYVGDNVRIHVHNADNRPHSFHIHGIEYGIDSDGAWPMGTQAADGRRSDEICPGKSWTYIYQVRENMIGAWPFHDHSSHASHGSSKLGLFGGIIIRKRPFRWPIPLPLPERFPDMVYKGLKLPLCAPAKKQAKPARRDPRTPLRARLTRRQELLLQNQYEDLREWLMRDLRLRFWPRPDWNTLHVPFFLHQMVSDQAKPAFDSGDMEENGAGTFDHTFDDAGSYEYFCAYHPAMTGTVNVVSGAPATATVNILDAPAMGFYPDSIDVAPGGTVTWNNLSMQHHTVTSRDGAALVTHCINGRGFVGNTPTIIARAGQKIRWYVFNLDFGHEWHNFHPHNIRWELAGENHDVRSVGPAESFTVDTVAPPALILPEEVAAIQDADDRPPDAEKVRLMGDFLVHCHVHHHMMNGMIAVVRSYQDVWLTESMKETLLAEGRIQLFDDSNPIPMAEMGYCDKLSPGTWEELEVDPEVTFMHACLLPDTNKVLYWGYTRADQSRLYDPPGPTVAEPSPQPAALPGMDSDLSDLWSAAHAFIPDGRVLGHGGFAGPGGNYVNAFVFDPATEQWSQTGSTAEPRFYATTLTLADGRIATIYGSASKSLEIWDSASGTWSAPVDFPAAMDHHQYYPWTYLLPDGRLFIAGPHDPTHRFTIEPIGGLETYATIAGNRSTGGEKGTSVLLPLRPPDYAPRVVVIGGNTAPARKTAELIDLSEAMPAWQSLPDLNLERAEQVNSVLLPDGHVLVVGGANAVAGGGAVELLDADDVASGFTLGPVMTHHRGYHSAAILLADGSVLVGGDPNSDVFERYLPGYFERPRPTIASAPASAAHGATITVDSPEAADIVTVHLLAPGAVTHGFNMSQRIVECAFTLDGAALQVELPPNGNIAPPGAYLLFIIDDQRVPSEGQWITIN